MSEHILSPDEDVQNPRTTHYTPDTDLNQRSRLHRAALRIAGQGKPVFPCKPAPDKSPLTGKGGFHKAATDPAKINMFWNRHHGASIGVPTGEASGFWVLDVDDLDALEELGFELPDTTTIRSPSGGLHYYFRHVAGITNSPGGLPEGIDVRGEGGYVLVPPSPGYTIENKASIAEAPGWLLERISSSRRRDPVVGEAGKPRAEAPEGEPVYEGGRNNTIFWKCDRWHQELSDDDVEAKALAFNEAYCNPPLPEDEVVRTARSACGYPVRHKEVSPEVKETMENLWRQFYEETIPGGGRSKERDCERVALEFAERFGTAIKVIIDGEVKKAVAVSISARQGAIPAAVSHTTFATNMKRLSAKGKIRPSGIERKDEEAKTWIILETATKSYTSPSKSSIEACTGVRLCRAPQRTPCFRWGGLVGNAAGGVLVAVERWGTQTADDLAERVGYSRGRDLKARHLDRLVEMGLLVEEDRLYSLSGAYEEKVGEVKSTPYATSSRRRCKSRDEDRVVSWVHESEKVASEIERERIDTLRYEDERKAFRQRLKVDERAEEEITALRISWDDERAEADGTISELGPVSEPQMVDGVIYHEPECGCVWCDDEPPSVEEVARYQATL